VREGAQSPRDRILVQSSPSSMKLVAGNKSSTLVLSLPSETKTRSVFTVAARVLLQSAKVLVGKGEVTLEADDKGLHLHTSTGGRATFPRIDGSPRDFILPAKQTEMIAEFEDLSRMGKVLKACAGDIPPHTWVSVTTAGREGETTTIALTASDAHKYARVDLGGGEGLEVPYLFHADALDGFKAIEEPGKVEWSENTVEFVTATKRLVARSHQGEGWKNIGFPSRGAIAGIKMDRKVLIEAIKGVSGKDPHERFQIAMSRKGMTHGEDGVYIGSFDSTDWYRVDGTPQGESAPLALSAAYALDILRSMDGKMVTIRWPESKADLTKVAFSSEENRWTKILLAPIASS
jgi:DNA polymerase III sliding clamp (beta) subunit (PCNA family)